MKQLLTSLRRFSETSYLSQNLELDFPSLKSSHKKAGIHGNNVSPEMENKFQDKLSNVDMKADLIRQLIEIVFHLCSSGKKAHFLCSENGRNLSPKDEMGKNIYFTRYISMKAFSRYIQQQSQNDQSGRLIDVRNLSLSEKRRMIDKFFKRLSSKSIPAKTFSQCWLGISPSAVAQNRLFFPFPVWITPGKNAPHDQMDFQRLQSEAERAQKIVKTVALPGYEKSDQIKENMGIVAISFSMRDDIDIFKPTILDAINSPYFFPGKKEDAFGQTVILNNQYMPTDNFGVKEFICKSFQVPVKINKQVMVEKIGYF